MVKIKDQKRILKTAREKELITKPHKAIEKVQDNSERQDLIKVLEVKYLQPRIFYPARLSFGIKGEIISQTSKN